MTSTSDLDATANELAVLVAQRGLRHLSAQFNTPDVFIDADETPADVLDAVVASAPPFVSLDVTRFDIAEFEASITESLDKRSEEISEEGRALIAQQQHRNGQVQHLALHWTSSGLIHAYFLVADWYEALEDAVEESAQQRDHEDAELHARRIRSRQLVDALEAVPEFRAQTAPKRRAKGERLLDSLMQEGDLEAHLPWLDILSTAVRLAQANAEEALDRLDLAEVAALPEWKAARTQAARTDLAERLLLERTGYGFVRSAADAFRRHVDATR